MESPKPGEPEAGFNPPVPEAAAGSEFLARFLSRKHESEQGEEDDEKEKDKPSKRWRRFWGKLFNNIAAPEPVKSRPDREEFDLPAIFERKEKPGLSEVRAEPDQVNAEQSDLELPTEISPIPTPEHNTVPVVERQHTPTPRIEQESIAPVAPEHRHTHNYDLPPVIIESKTAPSSVSPDTDVPRLERRVEQTERKAGLASGLVLLESLGRRRADKRLERRVARAERTAATQPRPLASPEIRQNPLAPETGLPTQMYEARPAPEAGRPAVRIERQEVEKLPADNITRTEHETGLKKAALTDRQPERVVFEQVVAAAEEDKPIEKLYERRHEIKDDKQAVSMVGGATSVGIVAAQKLEHAALTAAERKKLAKAAAKSQDQQMTNPYHQAAKNGFWTAMVMLAAATVILLTR